MFSRILLSLALCAGASATLMLTPDNFDTETAGKSVFIKFYAPWCGHCKKLAPAWDKLADEYAGDATKLIAKVDCTAAGKPLCDAHGVKGFPALKYGDPSNLEDYKGKRELKDLQEHVKAKLVPSCSPANIDLCDDEKKATIKKFQTMPLEELQALIDVKAEEEEAATAAFKKGVEGLQDAYEKLQEEKEAAMEKVTSSGYGLMKAVAKHAAKAAAPTEAKDEL
jgi:protein disulfide-isomerase-like protein